MKPRRPTGPGRYPLSLRRHPVRWERQRPTWRQARPGVIAEALKRAQTRPSGNWYVVGASRDVRGDRPLSAVVSGHEIVVWRAADGRLVAGPGVCPHLGAPLADSSVRCGTLVCHWHGLALNGTAVAGWEPLPVYDDGVLVWVRLDPAGGEPPLEAPVVPDRPRLSRSVAAVYRAVGVCEPEDVVANRLDPWHGAWFHPYSFVDLTVLSTPDVDGPGWTVPVARGRVRTVSPSMSASKSPAGSWCRSGRSSRPRGPGRSSCASRRARAGVGRRDPCHPARAGPAGQTPHGGGRGRRGLFRPSRLRRGPHGGPLPAQGHGSDSGSAVARRPGVRGAPVDAALHRPVPGLSDRRTGGPAAGGLPGIRSTVVRTNAEQERDKEASVVGVERARHGQAPCVDDMRVDAYERPSPSPWTCANPMWAKPT